MNRCHFVEEDTGEAYFVAFIEELDGLEADGDTPVDARANLADAFEDYINAMLEWGDVIPEPVAWPASLGWHAPRAQAKGPPAVVEIAAYVSDVPKADDPRSKTMWIDGVPEDATADTAMAVA
jgi:predicted RNase H-like HicB family nuclease